MGAISGSTVGCTAADPLPARRTFLSRPSKRVSLLRASSLISLSFCAGDWILKVATIAVRRVLLANRAVI